MNTQSPARESSIRAIFTFFGSSYLRPAVWKSTLSIFRNFFILQYKAALFPGRYPVSQVDHHLDEKIPFNPGKVDIYLEFLHFFIRAMGFLFRRFGLAVRKDIKNGILSLGAVYQKAAQVYATNYSTTKRPRYLARFRFLVIHTFDPNLMCIPSLHVMVVIRTYTLFRAIIEKLGEEDAYSNQIEELRNGALAITEAVLYIKQHSVNCISAAMYAMTCFDDLFPQKEAESFALSLFRNTQDISGHSALAHQDADAIRNHIIDLYRHFLNERTSKWETPLLDFLKSHPQA